MFEHIPAYAGDPVLSLVEKFVKDPRPEKINLCIGLFYNEEGKIPLLEPVRIAEDRLMAQHNPRSYLPMDGLGEFREIVREFVFGKTHSAIQEQRIATIQTIGGSGALTLTADFMHQHFPQTELWVSDPTWDNHRTIFEAAGLKVNVYPYYDLEKNEIRFEELLACVKQMPERSLVLMHPCCHNPTGMDLTQEQWAKLIPVFLERNLMVYLDIAYQGFGHGIEEDAWAVRTFASSGVATFVGSSFSKNCSMYGERVGALHVVCANPRESELVLGQLKAAVRQNYSSPPTHGAAVINLMLRDSVLRQNWLKEVDSMRARIREMRATLQETISKYAPGKDFSYFTSQQGMFSYTGLTPEQVDRLKDEFGIYLVRTGRMCIAGLNRKNIAYVAESMAKVLA